MMYYPVRLALGFVAILTLVRELWEQEYGSVPVAIRWGIPILTLVIAKVTEIYTGSRKYLDDNSDLGNGQPDPN